MTDPTYVVAFAVAVLLLLALIVAEVQERRSRRVDDAHQRRRRILATIDELREEAFRRRLRDEVQA